LSVALNHFAARLEIAIAKQSKKTIKMLSAHIQDMQFLTEVFSSTRFLPNPSSKSILRQQSTNIKKTLKHYGSLQQTHKLLNY
jgi:hypothetical protein